MESNLAKLNLDLGSKNSHKSVSELLTDVSMIADISEKSTKLKGYVRVLEDELKKIHAFKRELPLCMLLSGDAITKMKEEVQPVTEELIPLKGNSDEHEVGKTSSDFSEMKNWMSSAQLWSYSNVKTENCSADTEKRDLKSREKVEDDSAYENPIQLCKFGNRGGAFAPFKGQSELRMKEEREVSVVQGLSLRTPVAEIGPIDLNLGGHSGSSGSGSSSFSNQMKTQKKADKEEQHQKKQRRCWSPELHRRFVDALQQLGGAQTATPKHIRELMQVEGLTNDEVKSHLQKYRIHIRKVPASSPTTSKGLWAPQDRCGDASKPNNSHSGSPPGPLHSGRSAKGVSSMEEEEDEKSESHSWKKPA